jgi:hypothetical protein
MCVLTACVHSSFSILLWLYVEQVGSADRLDLVSLKSVNSGGPMIL